MSFDKVRRLKPYLHNVLLTFSQRTPSDNRCRLAGIQLRSTRQTDRSNLFGEVYWLAQREERHIIVQCSGVEAPMSHDSPHASLDMTNLGARFNIVITKSHCQSRNVPGIHTGIESCFYLIRKIIIFIRDAVSTNSKSTSNSVPNIS